MSVITCERRLKTDNMVALTSFPPPEEGVVHKQEATEAHVSGKGNMGNGTLYVAESRVSWRSERGDGFSLEYKSISLHAISRDLAAFPQPCLYLMVDADLAGEAGQLAAEEEEEEAADCDPLTEIRFVPQDPAALEPMYTAMCDCQQLHPDSADDDSEEELAGGEGEFYADQTGENALTMAGQQQLERLSAMLNNGGGEGQPGEQNGGQDGGEMEADENQFDDAEMER